MRNSSMAMHTQTSVSVVSYHQYQLWRTVVAGLSVIICCGVLVSLPVANGFMTTVSKKQTIVMRKHLDCGRQVMTLPSVLFGFKNDGDEETIHGNNENNENDDGEPDLFDYFDPLLSPHAYPDGISPNHKPKPTSQVMKQKREELVSSSSTSVFGFNLNGGTRNVDDNSAMRNGQAHTTPPRREQEEELDLFDYFDPLLSPHAYPNGISPKHSQKPKALEEDDRYNPLALGKNTNRRPTTNKSSKFKIGILLMDHGSRNEASNQRLEHLAKLYELSMVSTTSSSASTTSKIVVQAAHMEIASPSIPEGLKRLMEQGVDEIVCHPYFLSPGRHVQDDLPRIVEQAILELEIDIPVITTDPLGSNTQLMIGAIHSSVREHSVLLRQQRQSNFNMD